MLHDRDPTDANFKSSSRQRRRNDYLLHVIVDGREGCHITIANCAAGLDHLEVKRIDQTTNTRRRRRIGPDESDF